MNAHRPVRIATAAYTAMLRLYPAPFRMRFGDAVRDVFAEACEHAWESGGHRAVIALCIDTARDFALGIVAEYWCEAKRRARVVARSGDAPVLAPALLLCATPLLIVARTLIGPPRVQAAAPALLSALAVHCAAMYAIVGVAAHRWRRRRDWRAWPAEMIAAAAHLTRLALQVVLAAVVAAGLRDPLRFLPQLRAGGASLIVPSLGLSVPTVIAMVAFMYLRPTMRRASDPPLRPPTG